MAFRSDSAALASKKEESLLSMVSGKYIRETNEHLNEGANVWIEESIVTTGSEKE